MDIVIWQHCLFTALLTSLCFVYRNFDEDNLLNYLPNSLLLGLLQLFVVYKLLTPRTKNKFDKMSRNLRALIGPSILNADLSKLQEESQKLLDNGADYLHLDVMDGHFVPNLTFGHPVVKCLRSKIKSAFFETHMMVSKPEQWIVPMAEAGVDQYTFHIEPVTNVEEVCRKIKENGMKVGLAIKPGTPVAEVEKYIDLSDMVLIMTVEPGFGGQKFMENQMVKVKYLREHYPELNIEVDGGVGLSTIDCCANAGANMIVSGTAVIGAKDQAATIKSLRTSVQDAISKINKL